MPSSSFKKSSLPAHKTKLPTFVLPYQKSKKPKVLAFEADSNVISLRNPIHLKWEVLNADKVVISPNVGLVTEKGMIAVYPEENTQFVLTAYNDFGKVKVKYDVKLPPPKIKYFTAAEEQITIGYPTILHWEVENAAQIFIDKGVGEIDPEVSFKEVYFEVPGICSLTVINKSGRSRKQINLQLSLPEISYFWASSETIRLGQALVLHWKVSNAKSLHIDQEVGEVSGLTRIEAFPDRTTTYTLIASNHRGTVQKTLTAILPPPKIVYFEAENEVLIDGQSSTKLFWEVENAYSIIIEPDIGEVIEEPYVTIRPQKAFSIYSITAIGHSGQISNSVRIKKFPIPLETDFLESGNSNLLMKKSDLNTSLDTTNLDTDLEASLDLMKKDLAETSKKIKKLHSQARKKKKNYRKRNAYEHVKITEDMMRLEKPRLRDEIMKMFYNSVEIIKNSVKKRTTNT